MYRKFQDRTHAGRQLSYALSKYRNRPNTIILALPRGGVPVAHETARQLNLPMDIWLVRKLGVPGHEELAMGAITLDGSCHINDNVVSSLEIGHTAINRVIEHERREIDRRNRVYRDGRPAPAIAGKVVIIVDDGLATGATMRVAINSLRAMKPDRIIAAAPVGARDTCFDLAEVADEVVCLRIPEPFHGVGEAYKDFSQTSDEQVLNILSEEKERTA